MKTESIEATTPGSTPQRSDISGAVAARVGRDGKLECFSRGHYGYSQLKSHWWEPKRRPIDNDTWAVPEFLRKGAQASPPLTKWQIVQAALVLAVFFGVLVAVLAGLGWGLWHALVWVCGLFA